MHVPLSKNHQHIYSVYLNIDINLHIIVCRTGTLDLHSCVCVVNFSLVGGIYFVLTYAYACISVHLRALMCQRTHTR